MDQAIDAAGAVEPEPHGRLPVHVVERVRKLRDARLEIEERAGRRPKMHELAEATGFSHEQLRLLLASGKATISLDAPAIEGELGLPMHERLDDGDAPSPLESLSDSNMLTQIGSLLEVLDERERHIIELRFGLRGEAPQTLEQVGELYGVTRERIRQLQKVAVKKMRRKLRQRETPLPAIMRN